MEKDMTPEKILDEKIRQIPMTISLSCFIGRGNKDVVDFINNIFELIEEGFDKEYLMERTSDLTNFLAKTRIATLDQMRAVTTKINIKKRALEDTKTAGVKTIENEPKDVKPNTSQTINQNNKHQTFRRCIPCDKH